MVPQVVPKILDLSPFTVRLAAPAGFRGPGAITHSSPRTPNGLLLDEMMRTIRGISSAKLRAVSHNKNPDARPIHTQLYLISLHLKG